MTIDGAERIDVYTGFSRDDLIEGGLHFTRADQVERGYVVRERLVDARSRGPSS